VESASVTTNPMFGRLTTNSISVMKHATVCSARSVCPLFARAAFAAHS